MVKVERKKRLVRKNNEHGKREKEKMGRERKRKWRQLEARERMNK